MLLVSTMLNSSPSDLLLKVNSVFTYFSIQPEYELQKNRNLVSSVFLASRAVFGSTRVSGIVDKV